MADKKNVGKNYIYNVSYQLLAILTPLITTPYLSRVVGVDGIGAYSYTASIVAFFVLFAALGTATYGVREISLVASDKKARSETFWNIEILTVITTLTVAVAYAVFLHFQSEAYFRLYLIQSISLVSAAFNITWFFQGMEEFKKVVGRNILFRLLSVAFIFIFVRSEEDLWIYVLGLVGLECLGNLSIWAFLPQYAEGPHAKTLRPFSHFKGAFGLFVPTIAISIYTYLDKAMIGFFTATDTENGYYEQSMKMAKMPLTIVTAMETVMIPRIADAFQNKREEEMHELIYSSFRLTWCLALPLCLGLFGIADHLVPWFYGPGYEKNIILLRILCFLIPVIGLSDVAGMQYLMPTKREKLVTRSVIIGAGVNFIFNLAGIPFFYSVGAAVASVAAELIITGIQLGFIRKEIKLGKVFLSSWKYLVSALVMLGVLLAEGYFLSAKIGPTLIMIASGIAVYFLMLLALRDRFLAEQLRNIFKKEKL